MESSMKVVVAMDSFKGSMTSMEAGNAAKAGIERVCGAEVVVKPLADGGEGTTQALVRGADYLDRCLVIAPLLSEFAGRNFSI